MLLLLPYVLLPIHKADAESETPAIITKKRFLDGLRKALLTSKTLVDVAVRCYVDLVVVATFVAKDTATSCIRFLVPPVEQELKVRCGEPEDRYWGSRWWRPEDSYWGRTRGYLMGQTLVATRGYLLGQN